MEMLEYNGLGCTVSVDPTPYNSGCTQNSLGRVSVWLKQHISLEPPLSSSRDLKLLASLTSNCPHLYFQLIAPPR